jgi:hypothetical protein
LLLVLTLADGASAQTPPPVIVPNTAEVWVHPSDGVDDPNNTTAMLYVDDPSLKFRTLQRAIDVAQLYLISQYHAVNNPDQQAVVYALPGTYGSTAYVPASGDVLPIFMRDRVHVQGVGARRCTIRGASTTSQPVSNRTLTWPTQVCASGLADVEVLLTFENSTVDSFRPGQSALLPWYQNTAPHYQHDDTPETLDGFGFLGGDVQILFSNELSAADYFPAARVSNCLFDLRHLVPADMESTAELTGPSFGIMLKRTATWESFAPNDILGYLDARVLIAQNSFVFARWNNTAGNEGWDSESRPSTVGIIDFTDPNTTGLNQPDPDCRHRGVGNPCITGNLFRTRPNDSGNPVKPFAMLGIGLEDTQVHTSTGWRNTNAFDPNRVGSTNGAFYSEPVVAGIVTPAPPVNAPTIFWNCAGQIGAPGTCDTNTQCCDPNAAATCGFNCVSGTLPIPAVDIWDGTAGVDPAFVGEYYATELAVAQSPETTYEDWRIMPGSPLENMAAAPPLGGPRGFVTQAHEDDLTWVFLVDFPEECPLFKWDGEHWGNPRVMEGEPDIGFDERGLMIQAGNWANRSNSHNSPGFMQPTGIGATRRWFILPTTAGGVALNTSSRYLRLHDTTVTPVGTSAGDGWIHPPGALASPPSLGSLPQDFRTKYISFASQAAPDITLGSSASFSWQPLANATTQSLSFMVVDLVDDECSASPCAHDYYNLQCLIVDSPGGSTQLLRSNMQGEYR